MSPPQRQIQINAGQTLTIQCTARGSPAPYINWRLNWGHICGDGSDNGRCTMAQSIDPSDPSLVTGTLTVRNVNRKVMLVLIHVKHLIIKVLFLLFLMLLLMLLVVCI